MPLNCPCVQSGFQSLSVRDRLKGNLGGLSGDGRQPGRTLSITCCSTALRVFGKTTLAHIIANEMGSKMHITSGPAVERPGDLVGVLTNLDPGSVLFIDEIHRLSRTVEEYLYPAMEDFKVDIMVGKGPAARSIRMDTPRFTLLSVRRRGRGC